MWWVKTIRDKYMKKHTETHYLLWILAVSVIGRYGPHLMTVIFVTQNNLKWSRNFWPSPWILLNTSYLLMGNIQLQGGGQKFMGIWNAILCHKYHIIRIIQSNIKWITPKFATKSEFYHRCLSVGSPKWFWKSIVDYQTLYISIDLFLSDFSDTNFMLITWVVLKLWFKKKKKKKLPQFAHKMQIREILRFYLEAILHITCLIFRNLILHSTNNRPKFL